MRFYYQKMNFKKPMPILLFQKILKPGFEKAEVILEAYDQARISLNLHRTAQK